MTPPRSGGCGDMNSPALVLALALGRGRALDVGASMPFPAPIPATAVEVLSADTAFVMRLHERGAGREKLAKGRTHTASICERAADHAAVIDEGAGDSVSAHAETSDVTACSTHQTPNAAWFR